MNKDIVIKEDGEWQNEDWYVALRDDCQAIDVERRHNAHMEVIQCNWEIGQCISQSNDHMERSKVYGKKVIQALSDDLNKSPSHLYSCVQVYAHFGLDDFDAVVSKLPEGKNVTWRSVIEEVGVKKELQAVKEKVSFKMDDIIGSFKVWLITTGEEDEEKILQRIGEFKEALLNYESN